MKKKKKPEKIEQRCTSHVAIFQNLEAGLFSTWSLFLVQVGKERFVGPAEKKEENRTNIMTPPASRFKS